MKILGHKAKDSFEGEAASFAMKVKEVSRKRRRDKGRVCKKFKGKSCTNRY